MNHSIKSTFAKLKDLKKVFFFISIFFLFNCHFINAQLGNEWVEELGYDKTYYKFKTNNTGLHRIEQSTLLNSGIPLEGANFKVFSRGKEIPIYVSTNGTFGTSDYIEFNGQANDGYFDTQLYADSSDQANPYFSSFEDEGTYFIVSDPAGNGLHFEDITNDISNVPPPETYFMFESVEDAANTFHFGVPETLTGTFSSFSAQFVEGEGYCTSIISYLEVAGNLYNSKKLSVPTAGATNAGGALATVTTRVIGRNLSEGVYFDKDFDISINDNTYVHAFGSDVSVNDNLKLHAYETKDYTFSVPVSDLDANLTEVYYYVFDGIGTTGLPFETRISTGFASITYPRNFDFNNQTNFKFDVEVPTSKYFEITNFDGGSAPVIYDLSSYKRIIPQYSGGVYKFKLDPTTDTNRTIFITSTNASDIETVTSITPRNFQDISSLSNQGDYILIYNKQLQTGCAVDQVQRYVDYRSSTAGGAYQIAAYEIEDLYDLFAHGIDRHSMSIKGFVNYVVANWNTEAKIVNLLGKGVQYNLYRFFDTAKEACLIPSYGHKASDLMLTSATTTDYEPQLAIGRVPVLTCAQINAYLDKLEEYEVLYNAPCDRTDRAWQNDALHIAKGWDSEVNDYINILSDFENIMDNSQLNLDVVATLSNDGDQISPQACGDYISHFEQIYNDQEQVRPHLEKGLNLINYYGNSIYLSWQYDIGYPNDYNNEGKYPFILSNSAFVSKVNEYNICDGDFKPTMAEEWVLADNHGAIGFLAPTHFSTSSFLKLFSDELLKNLGSTELHGKSIGLSVQQTILDIILKIQNGQLSGQDADIAELLCYEFTYCGDPAVKLYSNSNPEFDVIEADISLSTSIINFSSDTSFDINFEFHNIGEEVSSSIPIEITQTAPDGTIVYTNVFSIENPIDGQVYTWQIPVIQANNLGENTITILIDPNNIFTEDCKDNNMVITTLLVTDSNDCEGEIDECGICNGAGIVEGTCDCDGALPIVWYADFDEDGLGDSNDSLESCEQPEGYILDNTDPYPNCEEQPDECGICNGTGIAEGTCDCDGSLPDIWYADTNNNGLGDPNESVESCEQPNGYVLNADDTGEICFNPTVNSSEIDSSNGFTLKGVGFTGRLGAAVSDAGDINGDGIDDIIVGAYVSNPDGVFLSNKGEVFIVFGNNDGFVSEIETSDLNGTNGFSIAGLDKNDFLGYSVSAAGDFNGDGIDDIIIGSKQISPELEPIFGVSYVIFGNNGGFPASFDLNSLDGSNGFKINGTENNSGLGFAVSNAGDINNDGLDDIVIAAPYASNEDAIFTGKCYVLFGNNNLFDSTFDLNTLDGANGFTIIGSEANIAFGEAISELGDINNDGIDDIIIGAPRANANNNNNSGRSYIVFGKNLFSANLNIDDLDGNNGFLLNGIDESDFSGAAVGGAGDINADGINDIIIGAFEATANGNIASGESYIVFGSNQSFSTSIELSDLDGNNGFILNGYSDSDRSGMSVAGIGDVNNDGIDDLAIGGPFSSSAGNDIVTGEAYVLFGRASEFTPNITLDNLNGGQGFTISGENKLDYFGRSVNKAGDVNGDGVNDLIIGAYGVDSDAKGLAGKAYIIFGKCCVESQLIYYQDADGDGLGNPEVSENTCFQPDGYVSNSDDNNDSACLGSLFNVDQIDGKYGIVIKGVEHNERFGSNVNSIGDFNGDGFSDMIASNGFQFNAEGTIDICSIIFGSEDYIATSNSNDFNGENGFTIEGEIGPESTYVSNAIGDVNNDGFDDIMLCNPKRKLNGVPNTGRCSIVYGSDTQQNILINVTENEGNNTTIINGIDSGGNLGGDFSKIGDFNNDGIDDFAITSHGTNTNEGKTAKCYIIYGNSNGFPEYFSLNNLDGNNGKIIHLSGAENYFLKISGIGDINADGFDDLAIGNRASTDYEYTGKAYTVFGNNNQESILDTDNLNGNNGFSVEGNEYDDGFGEAVSSAGDLNSDGIDDWMVSAPEAYIDSPWDGAVYVIFGKSTSYDSTFVLNELNGENGFFIHGINATDFLASSRAITEVDDFNNDGFNDILIGSYFADSYTGEAYLIYSKKTPFEENFLLNNLDGKNGLTFKGGKPFNHLGLSVSNLGDFNGDGKNDIIIGGGYSAQEENSLVGEINIIYGQCCKTFYEDFDEDGLGNPNEFIFTCNQPNGYVNNFNDDTDTLNCNSFNVQPMIVCNEMDDEYSVIISLPDGYYSYVIGNVTGDFNNTITLGPYSVNQYLDLEITDNSSGCTFFSSALIDCTVTSLNHELERQISVVPNPASNFINVRVDINSHLATNIKLFDVYGRLVLAKTLASIENNTFNLDVSPFSNGVYFLQVENNGSAQQATFIVN